METNRLEELADHIDAWLDAYDALEVKRRLMRPSDAYDAWITELAGYLLVMFFDKGVEDANGGQANH